METILMIYFFSNQQAKLHQDYSLIFSFKEIKFNLSFNPFKFKEFLLKKKSRILRKNYLKLYKRISYISLKYVIRKKLYLKISFIIWQFDHVK